MKKYNIGLSVFFILLGSAVIFYSRNLKAAEEGFGAGTWPTFLGGILILLSVYMLWQSLTAKKKDAHPEGAEKEPSETDAEDVEKEPIQFASKGMKRVYLVCAVLIVFTVILHWVGFYLACVFMLPLVMVVMGEKRPLTLFLVTGGVILAVYLIFGLVLHTPLPQGTIF